MKRKNALKCVIEYILDRHTKVVNLDMSNRHQHYFTGQFRNKEASALHALYADLLEDHSEIAWVVGEMLNDRYNS